MPIVLVLTLFVLFLIWLYMQRFENEYKPVRKIYQRPKKVHPPLVPPSPPSPPAPPPPPPKPLSYTIKEDPSPEEFMFQDFKDRLSRQLREEEENEEEYEGPVPLPELPPPSKPIWKSRRSITVSDEVRERMLSVEKTRSSIQNSTIPPAPVSPLPTKEMRQLYDNGFNVTDEVPNSPRKIQRNPTGYVYGMTNTGDDDDDPMNENRHSSDLSYNADIMSRPSRVSSDVNMPLAERKLSGSFELPPIEPRHASTPSKSRR